MKQRSVLITVILLFAATPVAAQTPTPPITPTATIPVSNTEWLFPDEPLVAYTYTTEPEYDPISYTITRDDIWKSARVALTTYEILGIKTWIYLAAVLLIPVAAGVVFRFFNNPPEV